MVVIVIKYRGHCAFSQEVSVTRAFYTLIVGLSKMPVADKLTGRGFVVELKSTILQPLTT